MTTFEHAMVGIDGALAAGLHRRQGWPVVALAGAMAVLPDWDALTILLGPAWYAEGHRVWGHNLLVAGLLAAIVSGLAYRFSLPVRAQRWMAARWPIFAVREHAAACSGGLALWLVVGTLAAYSHLLADTTFSIGHSLPVWGVPLFWPFRDKEWAYPWVPWGDIGATVILAAGMFAMLRWPAWTRTIAAGSLGLVLAYMVSRGSLPSLLRWAVH